MVGEQELCRGSLYRGRSRCNYWPELIDVWVVAEGAVGVFVAEESKSLRDFVKEGVLLRKEESKTVGSFVEELCGIFSWRNCVGSCHGRSFVARCNSSEQLSSISYEEKKKLSLCARAW